MDNKLKAKLIKRIKARLSGTPSLDRLTPESLKLLLVDIRYLLEVLNVTDRFKILKFHCDWVLHPRMSSGMARRLIKDFDSVWHEWIVNQRPIPNEFANSLVERITFHGFESELRQCLSENHILTLTPPTPGACHAFEQLYAGMVEDAWLEYTDKKHPTIHVNRARMRMVNMADHPPMEKGYTYSPGDYLPYYIEWAFMQDEESVFVLTTTFPSNALLEKERLARLRSK